MNGLDAIEEIRVYEAENVLPACPIIMLSASAMLAHQEAALQSGADVHLSKPISPARLINTVSELLIRAKKGRRDVAGG